MLKNLFAPTDMTQGTPWKVIGIFSIPMLLGNIAQQLYSTVDSIVVGKYIGDNALAAVGGTTPLLNMLFVLFVGIATGAGIMVSQYFGARQKEELAGTIGTCITITAISCLFLMVASPWIIRPLLVLFNTPESILDDSTNYLVISMIGAFGLGYYNILSGLLRGLGDSVSALAYIVVATIINIVLDVLFVAYFNMGVPGVAWATIIAQIVSATLCMIRLLRMKDIFVLKWSDLRPKKEYVLSVIRLGLPTGFTQAIFSSAMLIVQSLTNSFGEMFIAANVIVMRVDGFAMLPNFSFGTAMTTYAGQNVGAGEYDRVSKGAKQGTLLAVLCSAVITLTILIFGKYLMSIFTDTPELVDLSVKIMRILAVGYIAMAVTQSLSGVMRGAGDTVAPMWVSICTTVFARIPIAYGLVWLTTTPELPKGSFLSVPISLLITWLLGAALTIFFYARGKWKTKAIQRKMP